MIDTLCFRRSQPVKLYYHPISDNCRRVLATVHFNGRDDIELELLDLMKGAHRTPEYLALNPNGKVPTLVDGDTVLWESNAIMQYISSDSSLWPASKVRYDIARWQFWGIAHWAPPISKIVGERMIKAMMSRGPADEAVVEKAMEELGRFAGVLNSHLEGRDWLVGDSLTLADLSIAAKLGFAAPAGIDLAQWPQIQRWYGAIEELDAWQKSAPPQM